MTNLNITTMKSKLKLFIYAAVIILIVAACASKIAEKPFISPPYPKLDMAFTDFQIDAQKGDTLLFASGSRIIVPPDIWADSAGNKIIGNINIRYREFSNAGDVFLAGIPMAYDTAGKKETLITAGMFEIRSYKDNAEIYIAKDKSLSVQMASNEDNADYNFYYLDENAKNWKYIGYEKPVVNPKIQEIKDSIKVMEPEMPFPFDKSYFALNYESILDVYFKDNYYTINDNRKNPAPKRKAEEYKLTWSGIFGARYLTYNGISYRAYQMVWQMLDGKTLPRITKKCYLNDLKSLGNNIYNMSLVNSDDKKATIRVKAVMPIKQLFAFPADDWQKKYDEVMAKIKVEEKRLATQFAVYRTFEVSATGYHNWDRVYNRVDKMIVRGDFKFDKDIDGMEDLEIYYFVEGNKGFVKFPVKSDSIMIVPDSTAKFVAVISDTEGAVFSSQEYNKINFSKLKYKQTYTFNMKTVAINSKEDFMKQLVAN
jgi:hypothetical protein